MKKAKAPLDKHSRPPLERVHRIHQRLQQGGYPNATRLALDLEVSAKTVHRDLEFMRDRLAMPIEFDSVRNGYYYTEEVTAMPTMQITEGELFALVVAEKALGQYRGTTFEKPLLTAIKKLAAGLPETISIQFGDLERSISFHTRAEPILDLEVFRALADAVTHRKQLRLLYRKPGGGPAEERVVDPYHLGNINGEWYLFAHDHLRQALRTFAPTRIQSAAPTGKTFVRPKRFSLDDRLRDSFGVVQGTGSYEVVLRFNAAVADYIREKKWHDSQRLRDLPEGGVETRFHLSGLSEIERWILSWGGNCTVAAPPELAESVRRAARKILGMA
jgi:predicted DNA-binding transcriptional regulator YafY